MISVWRKASPLRLPPDFGIISETERCGEERIWQLNAKPPGTVAWDN